MKILTSTALALCFINLNSFAAIAKYEMKKNNGAVKFFALGNPSAIRIDGIGTGPEGRLEVVSDEKNSKIAGQFVFDLGSLNSGIDMRDSHMKEKYLEVEKFPTAKLTIETINLDGNILKNFNKTNVPFTGVMNLHGKEKTVSGMAELKSLSKDDVKVVAKFKVKSSDFNIEIPSFAGITVADEIDLEVEMRTATK
jgi:polyisoprenoid-binding protein YceI